MFVRMGRAMLRSTRMVRAHGPAIKAGTGKSLIRQFLEIGRLRMKGFTEIDYYIIGLHSQDESEYLGTITYNRLNPLLNPPTTGIIPFNKWVMSAFFKGAGLPTPKNYGVYHSDFGWLRDRCKPFRGIEDLRTFLRKTAPVVFKPLDGARCEGVRVVASFDASRDAIRKTNGTTQPLEEFVRELNRHREGMLVQERLRQHPEMDALNSTSLNTVRFETLHLSGGTIKPLLAVLRIGGNDSDIDGSMGGGVASAIDLEQGVAGPAYRIKQIAARFETYDRHPTNQARIDGFKVPMWQEIKTLALTAHMLLPFARDLSWDIGLTSSGPVLIEVNGYTPTRYWQKLGIRLGSTPLGMLAKELQ